MPQCKGCGDNFTTLYLQKKYCSPKCSSKNASLRLTFGITVSERNRLLKEQGNCCAICKTGDPGHQDWNVDHSHITGEIRGILCNSCNFMLGHSRDNIETLTRAIQYLTKGN